MSGSLAMGGGSQTNLHFTTLHLANPLSSQAVDTSRVVVFDDAGNEFNAAWGGGTLSMAGFTAVARTIPIFPRRTDYLGIRILGVGPSRGPRPEWESVAEFRIRNPAWGRYSQWTPMN